MMRQVEGLLASADCIFVRPDVVYDKYASSQDDSLERLLME
jgi:hypothetical protein